MPPLLTIDTVLGAATNFGGERDKDDPDPFLPTSFDGQEGVSMPFTYDLVMLCPLKWIQDHHEPTALDMLGTSARVGLLTSNQLAQGRPTYLHRKGTFSQFEKVGLPIKAQFQLYKARLIPAVMLWGGDVTFRVFEKMSAFEILSETLGDIREKSNDVFFDMSRLRAADFPKLPYVVQFRESSFGFACRLMAEHGISYFFDRGKHSHAQGNPGSEIAQNDTLVLAGPRDTAAKSCTTAKFKIAAGDAQSGTGEANTIANFTRTFRASRHEISAGNFDPLTPTKPVHADEKIGPQYDLMHGNSPEEARLSWEEFPVPVDRAPEGKEMGPISQYAEEAVQEEQHPVIEISGTVKNPHFVAGRTFQLDQSEKLGRMSQNVFQVTVLRIHAFENSHLSQSIGDFLLGLGLDVLNSLGLGFLKGDSPGKALDTSGAMVSDAWSKYVQSQQGIAQSEWLYPGNAMGNKAVDMLLLPALKGALGPAGAALLLSSIGTTLADFLKAGKGGFSIQIGAVPWGAFFFQRPPVVAPRPVANGPHLATVIGPQGRKEGEIFADFQLGRVRVRFPWHREISRRPNRAGPFEDDWRCAWVPVSQAWAGSRFGTQFLPRIGDQVLVEYVDGDPQRPIISGRVYHADKGHSNLPFLDQSMASQPVDVKSVFNAVGKENLTLSGIETRSVPKPDKGDVRYHLLRFDDHYNDEQLLLRSQGRLDVTAKCSHYDTTEGDRHVRVVSGKDANGKKMGGSSFTTVGGEVDTHIGTNRYEAVDGDNELTVKGDTQLDLKGKWTTVVGGDYSLNASNIVLEASQKLTLKVGGSTVVLNPCGVYVDGPMIYLQSGGPAGTASDATMKDVADAVKADPGEPAFMRTEMEGGCRGKRGGGGQRHERTVPAQHAPPCTQDSSQMICMPLSLLCTPNGNNQ
jgi:uncharacterized protein involved in type VI secretion and phage assembly